jgi:hypothetical protein
LDSIQGGFGRPFYALGQEQGNFGTPTMHMSERNKWGVLADGSLDLKGKSTRRLSMIWGAEFSFPQRTLNQRNCCFG